MVMAKRHPSTWLLSLALSLSACFPAASSPDEKTEDESFEAASLADGHPTTLQNQIPISGLIGPENSETVFRLEVPPGATRLSFRLETIDPSNGDADLYVRFGAVPTRTQFNCRSWLASQTETCRFDTVTSGTYFVMVLGYTAYTSTTLVATYVAPHQGDGGTPGANLSVHLSLGIPDDSRTDVAWSEHYLSVKPQYVISYNGSRKTPNWVSWELNMAWLGDAPRKDSFRTDSSLPPEIPQARVSDYRNNDGGYDRGHMCPSHDRTATADDNASTFLLSNVVPQASNLNQGPWAQLENYEVTLAKAGKQLFIISGGLYDNPARTIGTGVAVPLSTFRVTVVLDAPGQTAADVHETSRVIAVVIPNDDARVAATADWKAFRTTVRDIEAQTGFNFLSDVAPNIQDAVETRVDND